MPIYIVESGVRYDGTSIEYVASEENLATDYILEHIGMPCIDFWTITEMEIDQKRNMAPYKEFDADGILTHIDGRMI